MTDLRAPRRPFAALCGALLAPLVALPAGAAGPETFQHGGRATAQVGALTARGGEPSAVTYNPAAVARLSGLQLQAGLDFSNPTDEYDNPSGNHRANHTIQFPPAVYVTWRPDDKRPWAFGLGVDTPYWYRTDWNTAFFPGRFITRTSELRLFEVHPVVAYDLGDGWSVGGGLRYLFGSFEHGFNFQNTLELEAPGGGTRPVFFELEALGAIDVGELSWDLAVHYDATVWGFGAVFRAAADFAETDAFRVSVRDLTDPTARDQVLAAFDFETARLGFELPDELRAGVWIAPYPELRLELDLSYQAWSALSATDLRLDSPTRGVVVVPQPRDWNDTVSVRLAAEGEVGAGWVVGGGVAYEPSPVPGGTLEPGFPRGDALVYAAGFSYELPELSIDVGYSFHDFESRRATDQEPLAPGVEGRYSARNQVWSASARWRF